jgi:hypothetical protein
LNWINKPRRKCALLPHGHHKASSKSHKLYQTATNTAGRCATYGAGEEVQRL